MNVQRGGYVPALDGLRGIAVLAVLAFHYQAPLGQYGFVGVDLFFVLSGYLITSILVREWQRTGGIALGQFYRRRALRLFPALWAMLLFAAIFVPFAYIASTLLYVNNWAVGLGFLPTNLWLGHVWSLSIEEQFYLLWPLALVLLLPRVSPRRLALLTLALAGSSAIWRIVLLVGGADGSRVYYGTDSHADGILLGSALGLSLAFGLLPAVTLRQAARAGTFGVVVLAGLAFLPTMPNATFVVFGHATAALAGFGIIVAVALAPRSLIPRVLATAPLVGLGKVSYGLYLWQVPVLVYLGGRASALDKLLLTLLLVMVSYRFLEQPLLRLKATRNNLVAAVSSAATASVG